ncbi:MAG: glycosyltransferase family 39 protein [Burkholderiales bacterium]|nr:glycosyltransferase family 39 protein [Phycisphaerae bacterium]
MTRAIATAAPSPAPSLQGRGVAALAVIMVLCAFAGRAVFLSQPVNSDTAMFVYMGKMVTDGQRIGTDLVDNKLPTVGLLMSVPFRLLGAHWWAYTLLGLGLTIATCLMLARTAGRCLGARAIVPVGVASAIWLNLPPVVYGPLQLETIQVFFVTQAACAGMELLKRRDWRDAIVLGLCAGIAMWAKPTAAAIIPAITLAVIVATGWTIAMRLRMLALIAIGVMIPTIICLWLLMLTGMADALPDTIAQLRDYSANSTAEWIDALKPIFVLTILMFPVLVLGYIFRRDRVDRSALFVPQGESRAISLFIIAWLIMEMIGVIAQRRMYAYHFLVMGAPAAMLLGLFALRIRMISLGLALGPAAAISIACSVEVLQRSDGQARMTEVIGYLKSHAHAGQRVWMDDYPRLMVESTLRPGSRVPLTFLFANSDEAPQHFGGMILDDLDERRPEWLVLHRDPERYIHFYRHHMAEVAEIPQRGENFAAAWRRIDGYARSHYMVVERVDNIDILRRANTPVVDARD